MTAPPAPPSAGCSAAGRRPPAAASIREAAGELFAREGFSATTVRTIAAEAGVNPALVIRYFGSKEALFLEVMALAEPGTGGGGGSGGRRFADVLAGPLEELGQRLTRYVLHETRVERSTVRDVFVALGRATEHLEVRERLRETTRQQLVAPLAARLGGPDGELRAQLIAVQVSGLMAALWIAPEADLTGADPERVVALYGEAVQRLVDGPARTAGPVGVARPAP